MRANSPITRRDRLLELKRSRTQADPWLSVEELAVLLCTTTRTIQRDIEALRVEGKLPPAP